MARIRTIKPEFWDDEKLADIPMQARLMFIGIWNFADDFGVILASPKFIKSKVFPYEESLRDSQIKLWLDALTDARMLIPFDCKDKNYLYIRTFTSHQIIDKRYTKSILPDGQSAEKLLAGLGLDQNTTLSHSDHDVFTRRKRKGIGRGLGSGSGRGKEFSPPTLEEVIIFFKTKNFPEDLAKKAFDHYDVADWIDSQGNKVKNWKQKMQTVWMTENEKNGNKSGNRKEQPKRQYNLEDFGPTTTA